jgi:hypothetical protein
MGVFTPGGAKKRARSCPQLGPGWLDADVKFVKPFCVGDGERLVFQDRCMKCFRPGDIGYPSTPEAAPPRIGDVVLPGTPADGQP